jgi:glutamine transport system substrate-binding protein
MKTLTSLLGTCKISRQAATRTRLAGLMLMGILGASTAIEAAETVTLKVAADPSSIPFAYMDQKSHQMEGFDMDLIRALGGVAGYKVEILPLDFAGIIPALQSGNVDAAASSVTITDARKKVIDFSSPYYDSGLQMLVRDGDKSINTIDDLKGKTVAALTGTTGYNFTQQTMGNTVKLVPYATSATAFLALVSGSVDAVISDQPVVANYAENAGKGRAKVVGPLYHGEQFGIAFAKGSKWVEPTNKALEKLKADGTYATLYTKWFGSAPQNTPIQ